jgi:hypothetical protein
MRTLSDISLFPDLNNYIDYYNGILNPYMLLSIEVGWYWLNKMVYIISGNSFTLFFTVSLIIVISYIITIKRYSAIVWLSVFLFITTLFYNSLFILRQNVAIAICLLSIPYILSRNPIKFFLVALLALSFHYSAIIWILVYFVYPMKIDIKYYFFIGVGTLLVFIYMEQLLNNALMFSSKISAYTDYYNRLHSKTAGSIKSLIVPLSNFALFIYAFRKQTITGYNKLFFILIVFNINLYLINYLGTSFTQITRLSPYFSVASIILLPNAIANIKNKMEKHVFTMAVCIAYLFLLNSTAQYGYGFSY